jgi:hypothetical protein
MSVKRVTKNLLGEIDLLDLISSDLSKTRVKTMEWGLNLDSISLVQVKSDEREIPWEDIHGSKD